MTSRREFLGKSIQLAGAVAALGHLGGASRPEPSILVNHVGFPPAGAKTVLCRAGQGDRFVIVDPPTGEVLHRGPLRRVAGDLGDYAVGDFTTWSRQGSYRIEIGGLRSEPFMVARNLYDPAIAAGVGYFAKQRCGDGQSGYNTPCHLDDGRRGSRRIDVTGGWHDACDVRKWVEATIYGMMGLSRLLDAGYRAVSSEVVLDELRWGNRYFLAMQDPAGFVMSHCGGDDGNHFTDNRRDTDDDRQIHAEPCDVTAQYQFIAAQAALARQAKADRAYAEGCAGAAVRCLEWCLGHRSPGASRSRAAAAIACCQLHRALRADRYRALAERFGQQLLELQVGAPPARDVNSASPEATGFFRAKHDGDEPAREVQHGNLPLMALCELLETFPRSPAADQWRDSLRRHCDYLVRMASLSAFGTIPFGLYSGGDPGGGRRLGGHFYRWFMKPRSEYGAASDWWVGVNAHLASHGVGLLRAGRILRDPVLEALAQRQLDWILGVNPFNASTMTGVGRNQPRLYVTGQFKPPTPLIAGGVMNGIGGSADDRPDLAPGSYHTCEYWTPMVAYTLWLMAELQA